MSVPDAKVQLKGDTQVPRVCLDHLLNTAADQFAQFGLDGISIRNIGREAGLKAPSICYHFSSKNNLYREAFMHKIEHTIDFINERTSRIADKKHQFVALVEALFDLFSSDRSLLALMQRDVIDGSLNKRPLLCMPYYAHFTSMIRRLGSDHVAYDIGEDTAFTVGAMIFGYCELAFTRTQMEGRPPDEQQQSSRARLVKSAICLVEANRRLA